MGRTLLIRLGHWLQRWGDSLVERYQPANPTGDLADSADRATPSTGASANVPPPHWVALVQDEAPWLLEDYVWPRAEVDHREPAASAATQLQTDRTRTEPEPERVTSRATGQVPKPPAAAVPDSPAPQGRPGRQMVNAGSASRDPQIGPDNNAGSRRQPKTDSATSGQSLRPTAPELTAAELRPNLDRQGQIPGLDRTARTKPASATVPPKRWNPKPRWLEVGAAAEAGYRKQPRIAPEPIDSIPAPRPAPLNAQPIPNSRQFGGHNEAAGIPNRQNPPATSQRLIARVQAPARPQQPLPIRASAARPVDPVDPVAFAHNPPPAPRPQLGAVPAQPMVQAVSGREKPTKPDNWERQNWPQLPDESANQFALRCQRWPELPDQLSDTSEQPQRRAEPMARELERNRRLTQEQRGLAWNE